MLPQSVKVSIWLYKWELINKLLYLIRLLFHVFQRVDHNKSFVTVNVHMGQSIQE